MKHLMPDTMKRACRRLGAAGAVLAAAASLGRAAVPSEAILSGLRSLGLDGARFELPPPPPDAGFFPQALWQRLEPPDAATLSWLSGRIPGLPAGRVRLLTAQEALALLDRAAARGASIMDVFTDAGLTGDSLYYAPQDVLQAIGACYQLELATPLSGRTRDDPPQPFVMQGLVIGGGKLQILYSLGGPPPPAGDWDSGFEYKNPDYPRYDFIASGRVTESIAAPGDLRFNGLWLVAAGGLVHPHVERLVKTSGSTGLFITNHGRAEVTFSPLRRKTP